MRLKFLKLYKSIKFNNSMETQFQPRAGLPNLEMELLKEGLIRIKTDNDEVLVTAANVEFARKADEPQADKPKVAKSAKD